MSRDFLEYDPVMPESILGRFIELETRITHLERQIEQMLNERKRLGPQPQEILPETNSSKPTFYVYTGSDDVEWL